MLTFSYSWIFLLIPLPWILRAALPARHSQQASVLVPFGARLATAISRQGPVQRGTSASWKWLAPGGIWLLALSAVARPQWIEAPITKELPTRDLLLLVDLSSSMQQEDFQNASGETVDRLTAVKQVLGDFLERRQGDRVGLVVFGDAAYLQAPFSTDLDLSRQLLDECQIGMAGPRTALGDAIGLGVNLFDGSDAPAKTMIALTDGNDTKSRVPPVEAARIAAQRDIRIHAVAMGDPTTTGEDKLDEQALREVAGAADGSYFFAADRQQLEGIYEELDRLETSKVETVSHRPRRDLYYWPLWLAIVVSMAHRLLPTLGRDHGGTSSTPPSVRVNPATGQLELES